MEELTPLDHRLIDSASEAVEVLRCLNVKNLYKVECLLCQIWQEIAPSKRSGIGTRFKWLAKEGYLPLDPVEPDSDGSMLYRIL